jgi:hypothetical protein
MTPESKGHKNTEQLHKKEIIIKIMATTETTRNKSVSKTPGCRVRRADFTNKNTKQNFKVGKNKVQGLLRLEEKKQTSIEATRQVKNVGQGKVGGGGLRRGKGYV